MKSTLLKSAALVIALAFSGAAMAQSTGESGQQRMGNGANGSNSNNGVNGNTSGMGNSQSSNPQSNSH
jgi:hypothetical protein